MYLEINIPRPMAKEPDWKALPPGGGSAIISSPLKTTPLKPEREVSMTMEVRSLLSQVISDMSAHRSGNSTPKRTNPVVILTPPPHKLKDLPKLVDTSSEVSTQDDVEMAEASLREVPHHHLSHSCGSKVQEHHPACRCRPTLREGQQSPTVGAGHEIIHRHL